jgi:DNA-binding transcriptional LysR family regulator
MNLDLFTRSGLSLERLRSFCLVATVESFTKAAEGDPNRQTLYSRQIKDLERFFGVDLFVRKGRTVSLSKEGKQLHHLALEYFSALEDFHERCSGGMGTYSIGTGESIIQWELIPKLAQIKELFDKADVVFKNMRTADIVDSVRKGEIDFGIIRKTAVVSELESAPAGKLQFAYFFPKGLLAEEPSEETILEALPLVVMEGRGKYQDFIADLPNRMRMIVKESVSCSSFPMMAKTLNVLPIAAILPSIAESELSQNAFEKASFQSLKPLDQELCICWNRRLASLNPEITRLGGSLSKIVTY